MSRAREQANLSSDSNIFVDIANDRTGIGVTTPSQKLEIAGNIKLGDNQEILIGTGSDLKLWHDGTHSYIRTSSGTQNLNLQTTNGQVILGRDTGHIGLYYQAGGTVELRYNNTKRFETTNTGATVTGDITISDKIIHAGDTNTAIRFPSNDVISFERGGSEALRITTANAILTNGVTAEPLYPHYTTARKIQAEFKGALDVGQTRHHGSLAVNCTNSNSFIGLVRSDNTQTDGTGIGVLGWSGFDGTDFHQSAAIEVVKGAGAGNDDQPGHMIFKTNSGTTSATERLRITSGGNVHIPGDSKHLYIGAGQELSMMHDGTHSYVEDIVSGGNLILRTKSGGAMSAVVLQAGQENSLICHKDGNVELYYDAVKKVETTSAGAKITGNLEVTGVLTYDDVTNIDSVGIVTARTGIHIDDSITHIGDTNTKIRFPAADTFTIETAGSERVRIHADGEVECKGGAAGQNALLVTGTYSSGNNVDIQTWQRVGGAVQAKIGYKDATTSMFFGTDTAHTLAIMTSGTERLRIDSSGRILIGVTASYANASIDELQIGSNSSSNQSGITIGSTDECAIAFADAGDVRAGSITYNHGSDAMIFKTNGTANRLRIDSSGNILLSKGTQNTLMSNTSDGSDNQSIFVGGGGGPSDTRGAYIWAKGNEYTTTGGYLQLNAGNVGTAPITFSTGGNERLRITSAGLVGINQTPSTAQLVVKNSDDANRNSIDVFNDNGNVSTSISQDSSGSGSFIQKNNSGTIKTFIKSYGDSYFTGGKIGIGIANPVGNLEVRDSKANLIVAKTGLTVKANSALHTTYDFFQIGAGGAIASYSTETVTASTHFIHNAYRGTDAAWKRRYADTAMRLSMNSPGGAFRFESAASGSANADITWSEKLRITSAGSVGIGTDNPQRLLHLYGGTAGTTILLTNPSTGHTTSDGSQINIRNDDNGFTLSQNENSYMNFRVNGSERLRIESDGDFRFSSGDAGTNYGGIRGWNASTGDMIIDADKSATGTSGSNLIFRSRGSEKMRITSAGKVSITSSGVIEDDPFAGLYLRTTGYDIASGNAIKDSTMGGMVIHMNSNDDKSVGLWFTTNNAHWSGISGQRSNSASTWGTDLRFYTHEDATNDLTYARERLRITSGGQIFIGGNTGYNESSALISFATDSSAAANMLSNSSAIYNHNNPAFIHVQNRYNTGTGQEAGIIFHSRSSHNGSWAIYGKRTSSSYLSDLIFRNRTGGSSSAERLRIKSDGNIIPGTNNTTSIGDGSTNFNSIWASTRFRGNDNVKLVLGSSQNLVVRYDGSNNIIGSPVGNDLHIKSGTGDNDNQLIASFKHSNASVGIGIADPTEKLHVQKNHNGHTRAIIQNNWGANATAQLKLISPTDEFQIAKYSSGDAQFALSNSANIKFHIGGTERMKISSSGYVTKPNTPYFHAQGSPSINNSPYDNGVKSFATVNSNNGSHYNNSTGIFTVPVAGFYWFSAGLWSANSDANNGTNYALLYKRDLNGNQGVQFAGANHHDAWGQLTMAAGFYCATGDKIYVYYNGSLQGSTPRNYFSGCLIG